MKTPTRQWRNGIAAVAAIAALAAAVQVIATPPATRPPGRWEWGWALE